jgi:hypothetical protein
MKSGFWTLSRLSVRMTTCLSISLKCREMFLGHAARNTAVYCKERVWPCSQGWFESACEWWMCQQMALIARVRTNECRTTVWRYRRIRKDLQERKRAKGISFALHSSLVSSVSLDIHFLCHMFSFLPFYFIVLVIYPASCVALREYLFSFLILSFIPLLQATWQYRRLVESCVVFFNNISLVTRKITTLTKL